MSGLSIERGARLLVSRTDRLGDLILALPFIQSLAARYPDNPIDVAASVYASPILDRHPAISQVIRVLPDMLKSHTSYRRDFKQSTQSKRYAAVVVLHPEKSISQLYRDAQIPVRIGTAGRLHSVLYTHRLLHSRKSNKKHESEYNLDFLGYFIPGETSRLPELTFLDREMTQAAAVIQSMQLDSHFVVIHPGSGGSANRWPLAHFIALASQLSHEGIDVVLSGSADEQRQIATEAGSSIAGRIRLLEPCDLRQLALVLKSACLAISNSTGPLHLAAAVGTPVIGLYSSEASVSPVRWGPLGNGHTVFTPSADNSAMSSITVDQVAAAAATYLAKVAR